MLPIIILSESESNFGAQLYNMCRSIIYQFAAMSRHCLRGGERDVVRMVEGRVVGVSWKLHVMHNINQL